MAKHYRQKNKGNTFPQGIAVKWDESEGILLAETSPSEFGDFKEAVTVGVYKLVRVVRVTAKTDIEDIEIL